MSAEISETADIVFRGIDGAECERFLAAIGDLAFREEWHDDRKLLYARNHLASKALRWFAQLDPSKKQSWDHFVLALLDAYPSLNTGAVAGNPDRVESMSAHPTNHGGYAKGFTDVAFSSALASSRRYNPSAPGRHFGRLRIVADVEEHAPLQYVWKGPHTSFYNYGSEGRLKLLPLEALMTTFEPAEALVVSFLPSSGPHSIGCLNFTNSLRDLVLTFRGRGADTYRILVENNISKLEESYSDRNVSHVWNVLSDGTVQASLADYSKSRSEQDFKTTEIHVDTCGASIAFVKPGTPLPQTRSNLSRSFVKARLVVEPL